MQRRNLPPAVISLIKLLQFPVCRCDQMKTIKTSYKCKKKKKIPQEKALQGGGEERDADEGGYCYYIVIIHIITSTSSDGLVGTSSFIPSFSAHSSSSFQFSKRYHAPSVLFSARICLQASQPAELINSE